MKKNKKKPILKKKILSLRHKKVLKKMSENGGKIGKAMRDSGYSKEYSNNPQKLMRGKKFNDLIKEVIPESSAVILHKKLMSTYEITYQPFPKEMPDKIIKKLFKKAKKSIFHIISLKKNDNKRVYFITQDLKTAQVGLDMYYKSIGNYAPIKIKEVDPDSEKTDEELLRELEELKAKRKKVINKK